jgi:hypothetical protein
MPRPSDRDRKRIEANRKANAARRDDEAKREKQAAARVQKIISNALDRPRTREMLPDLHSLIEKLESAYDLAMASGQAKSAVDATMAMGRLLGLVVDKSAIAVGDFRMGKTKEEILNDLQESIGEGPTRRFMDFIESERRRYRGGDAIEVEHRRLDNGGGANGADHE